MVFDLRRDEVRRFASVEEGLQNAGEREVVAFSAAGGEDDLFGLAVEQGGDGRCGRARRRRERALAGLMG